MASTYFGVDDSDSEWERLRVPPPLLLPPCSAFLSDFDEGDVERELLLLPPSMYTAPPASVLEDVSVTPSTAAPAPSFVVKGRGIAYNWI